MRCVVHVLGLQECLCVRARVCVSLSVEPAAGTVGWIEAERQRGRRMRHPVGRPADDANEGRSKIMHMPKGLLMVRSSTSTSK